MDFKNIAKTTKNGKVPQKYIDGESFKVLGKNTILKISYENIKKAKLQYCENYFLISLPKELKESSLIIQKLLDKFYMELAKIEVENCHLKYMNYSKNFWKMIEKYMPDYKQAEAELKM